MYKYMKVVPWLVVININIYIEDLIPKCIILLSLETRVRQSTNIIIWGNNL